VISGKGSKVAVSVIITSGWLRVAVKIAVGWSSNVPIRSGVGVVDPVANPVGKKDAVGERVDAGVQVRLAVAVGVRIAVLVTVTVGLMVLVAVRVGVIVAVGVTVVCCWLILPQGSRSPTGASAA
jgi:hypothetical protein